MANSTATTPGLAPFRRSGRTRAALVVGSALLAAAVSFRLGSAPIRIVEPGRSDIVAFRAVVNRMRQGEPYYAAMADELRTRGYPMQSAFNWRTPLHLRLVALATDPMSRVALVFLALVAVVTLWLGSPRRHLTRAAAATTLLATLLVTAAPDLVFLPETWAGVLIACSAGAFAHGRTNWGVGAGLAALAFRELAAPYCVACTVIAAADRDRPQVRAWLLGAVAYGLYLGWHLAGIATVRHADDLAQTASWLQLGGVPAVLTAMRWASWWFLAPPAAAPVLFALVVAGVCATDTPRHSRWAAAIYVGFLLVAGQRFNHYWGLMAAPVWAFVAGCGAASLAAAASQLRPISVPTSTVDAGPP